MPDPSTGAVPPNLCVMKECADFYQEIAQIKLAIKSKTLDKYLASDGSPAPVTGLDYANGVGVRLLSILRQQERDVGMYATLYELEIYRQARYLMAALADEIFILELQDGWPGATVWIQTLLEQKLFQSNLAGYQVFVMADDLLKTSIQTPLHGDLAKLILFTLKLGFQGRYRDIDGASAGKEQLAAIRKKLVQYVRQKKPAIIIEQSDKAGLTEFLPACENLLQGSDQRLGSTGRWKSLALSGALTYIFFMLIIWWVLIQQFERYIKS